MTRRIVLKLLFAAVLVLILMTLSRTHIDFVYTGF